jgi:hypothetical protein
LTSLDDWTPKLQGEGPNLAKFPVAWKTLFDKRLRLLTTAERPIVYKCVLAGLTNLVWLARLSTPPGGLFIQKGWSKDGLVMPDTPPGDEPRGRAPTDTSLYALEKLTQAVDELATCTTGSTRPRTTSFACSPT